jgi:hypothetical protein
MVQFSMALILASLTGSASTFAVEFTIVLLDPNNTPLGKGGAVPWIYPAGQPDAYVEYLPNQRIYISTFPETDSVAIDIFNASINKRLRLNGFSGRTNQTIVLRPDRVGPTACGSSGFLYDIPSDYLELLNLLDEKYPNGVPQRLSNIRQFLSNNVLPVVHSATPDSDASAETQLEQRKEISETLERIHKHLR